MINIRPKKDYMVALESVAMTDIVLNMFIFFFISFSLIYTFSPTRLSKIEVNLPKASSAVTLDGSEKTVLVIDKRGDFFLDDVKLDVSGLKKALAARSERNADLGLLLKVDGMARFESIAEALDIINGLGITRVSVLTRDSD